MTNPTHTDATHYSSPSGGTASAPAWRVSRVLWGRARWAGVVVVMLSLCAVLLAGCESSDASLSTSPSVLAMIGTTAGNTEFDTANVPPPVTAPAKGWQEGLGQASWTKLQNGFPAIMVVISMESRPGAGMEIWLTKDGDKPSTVAHWFGGASAVYEGTVCFQVTTQEHGAALNVDPNAHYSLTIDFLDPTTGVIASQTRAVAGNTPTLQGHAPGPEDIVFSNTYACPKGQ